LIFGYALGGKTFHIYHDDRKCIAKNETVSKNTLALLAVCRQVFAETALLPFSSNTFSAEHPQVFNMWIEDFPSVFAEAVTSVHFLPFIDFSPPDQWSDIYDGIPNLQNMSLGHGDKRISPNLVSLKCVQLSIGIRTSSDEWLSTRQWECGREFTKGLYETENSGIKFTGSPRKS